MIIAEQIWANKQQVPPQACRFIPVFLLEALGCGSKAEGTVLIAILALISYDFLAMYL